MIWQIRKIPLSCMTRLVGQSRFRTPFLTMWHRVCPKTGCLLVIGRTTVNNTKWKTKFHPQHVEQHLCIGSAPSMALQVWHSQLGYACSGYHQLRGQQFCDVKSASGLIVACCIVHDLPERHHDYYNRRWEHKWTNNQSWCDFSELEDRSNTVVLHDTFNRAKQTRESCCSE